MKRNQNNIDTYLGHNPLGQQAFAALGVGTSYVIAAAYYPQLRIPLLSMASVLVASSVFKGRHAWEKKKFHDKLIGLYQPWMTYNELARLKSSLPKGQYWLGYGFLWDTTHCQLVTEFTKSNWREKYRQSLADAKKNRYFRKHYRHLLLHPLQLHQAFQAIDQRITSEPGYRWIHALGDEKPQCLASQDLEGHMAVFGTTGAGKSRFLEVQIVQAILDGKCVIVLDPKGDTSLVSAMKKACELSHRKRDFLYFHMAHPDQSINLNLLANYSRIDEIASRISDTLPGQNGEGKVFIDIGRGHLRTLCSGLELLGQKPTFRSLHHYYLYRQDLASDVLEEILKKRFGEHSLQEVIKNNEDPIARYTALKEVYENHSIDIPEVDNLLALAEQSGEFINKTTQSTLLLLSSLTGGTLGKKLSPSLNTSVEDSFFDSRKIIERRAVFYMGLDSLTDSGLANTIGSMMLSDLAATAGARYDFETAPSPVALFVDEAAELTSEPFTQMLNKSRGAKFSICLASQTISDFVAKAKDQDQALRILANLNNFVALRCNDIKTQQFLTNRVLKTRIHTTIKSHGVATNRDHLMATSGSISERVSIEETDLVPAPLLSSLPNCEFFGVFAGGHVIKGRVPILVNQSSDYWESL